jgi:hypothetical protein
VADDTGSGATLTLGTHVTLNHVGTYAALGAYGSEAAVIDNEGTILADYAGGQFYIGYDPYEGGAASFTNDGSIDVANGDSLTMELYGGTLTNSSTGIITAETGATLTLGQTEDTFDNAGTITIDGATVDFVAPLTNTGTIVVTDGTVDLDSFTNTGKLSISDSSITLTGSITTALLDTFGGAGNAITIDGTLDNSGATLTVGPGTALGTITLGNSGTILDGTIKDGGSGFTFNYGTLDGVTYDGTLDLSATSADLTVVDGITLHGSGGTGAGDIELTGEEAQLLIAGTTTLDNVTIDIGSDSYYSNLVADDTGSGATLTLGTHVTLNHVGTYAALGAYGSEAAVIDNEGTILADYAGGQFYIGYDPYEGGAASFTNDGSIDVANGDSLTMELYGGTLTNSSTGIITAETGATLTLGQTEDTFDNAGTITIDGGYVDIDTTTFTSSGAISIGNGGTLEINPATAANITYNDPANLILDDPSGYTGTLSGLMTGDTLQLSSENISSAGISGTTMTVHLHGGGTLTYKTGPGLNGTTFSVGQGTDGNNDLLTVLCFLPGTMIATPSGETPVEALEVGDRVRTASGAVRPIAWIGQGRVLATRGQRSAATPVVVGKGALGPNVPHRDLRVTKAHSLFLDGVLIPAEFLVNHRTIYWDDRAQEVVLYHIELETHDVLLANGAPAESYRDDGNRWLFQNANSGWHLPPQPACAPVLTGGPVVDAVWRRLLERAGGPTRLALTQDAQIALLVDGRRLAPTACGDDMAVFILDGRPRELRLVSRSAVPLELGLSRDARELGVAVRQLAVRKGARPRVIEAEDARLTDGFHGFEANEGIRWTNGDAVLPAELFAGFKGEFELAVHLGGATHYVDDGAALRAA